MANYFPHELTPVPDYDAPSYIIPVEDTRDSIMKRIAIDEFLENYSLGGGGGGSIGYNVFDYGAIGDGQADDTEAFRSAIDAACGVHQQDRGGIVYVPQTQNGYKISDTLHIYTNGVWIVGEGMGSRLRMVSSALPNQESQLGINEIPFASSLTYTPILNFSKGLNYLGTLVSGPYVLSNAYDGYANVNGANFTETVKRGMILWNDTKKVASEIYYAFEGEIYVRGYISNNKPQNEAGDTVYIYKESIIRFGGVKNLRLEPYTAYQANHTNAAQTPFCGIRLKNVGEFTIQDVYINDFTAESGDASNGTAGTATQPLKSPIGLQILGREHILIDKCFIEAGLPIHIVRKADGTNSYTKSFDHVKISNTQLIARNGGGTFAGHPPWANIVVSSQAMWQRCELDNVNMLSGLYGFYAVGDWSDGANSGNPHTLTFNNVSWEQARKERSAETPLAAFKLSATAGYIENVLWTNCNIATGSYLGWDLNNVKRSTMISCRADLTNGQQVMNATNYQTISWQNMYHGANLTGTVTPTAASAAQSFTVTGESLPHTAIWDT